MKEQDIKNQYMAALTVELSTLITHVLRQRMQAERLAGKITGEEWMRVAAVASAQTLGTMIAPLALDLSAAGQEKLKQTLFDEVDDSFREGLVLAEHARAELIEEASRGES